MAKRRKMTAKQLKYFGPRTHKKARRAPVAKRRRRRRSSRKSHAIVRRRSHAPARRTRRRHSGGGGITSIIPGGQEMKEYIATGVYGFLESKAKADPNFLMNKLPQPITQLGYAGNVALILRAANKLFIRNPWVALLASGAAHAAMYQMGRRGGLATDTAVFSIAGDGYLGHDEDMGWDVEGLAVEGADISGTDFDPSVHPGT